MIEMQEVSVRYGRADALHGLSLSVPQHAAFALLGANGAGKTTLIRTLMNILSPSRGTAQVMGIDSRRLGPAQFAKIGFVSENQKMPDRMTVAQFLAYLRPFYPSWDKDLEAALFARLDLPNGRRIGHLSHGMKMKLRLIAALSFRPTLLLLDEPLSGLDPLIRDEFLEGVLDQAEGTTILISSHELHEIEGFATHVGFIESGSLLFQQSIDDLRARVRAVEVTLEVDARLPAAMPDHWLDVKAAGSVVSFVDVQFTPFDLEPRIAARFGAIRRLEVRPVGLRPTFTAIARSLRRKEA